MSSLKFPIYEKSPKVICSLLSRFVVMPGRGKLRGKRLSNVHLGGSPHLLKGSEKSYWEGSSGLEGNKELVCQ